MCVCVFARAPTSACLAAAANGERNKRCTYYQCFLEETVANDRQRSLLPAVRDDIKDIA